MKIGRHEYTLVAGDKFLDNGACVQLLTQSKEKESWGYRPRPLLSKIEIKELKSMDNISIDERDGYVIYEIIDNTAG